MSPTDRDARRRSEARLAAVLESIDDHLVSYDLDWRFTFVSATAAEQFGRSAGDLLGRNVWLLFPEMAGGAYHTAVHAAMRDQAKVRIEHRDEVHGRWHENHIFPSMDGVTVFTADITRRKEAEAVIHESDRKKDEFLATLAHELRNPLAPISNAVHVLRMIDGVPPEAERLHQLIEHNTVHLVRMVDDLIELSRLNRGKVELRRERIDLRDILSAAVDDVRSRSAQRIDLDLPHHAVSVDADPLRLGQVADNLLSNAAKFTPEDGHIAVSLTTDSTSARLTVRDSGMGVPAELLGSIFEMFAQSEADPQPRARGSLGIGLALARALTEMHDGEISVRSDGAGQGSEFTVTLPLATPGDSPEQRDAPESFPAIPRVDRESKPRIMVVDDSRDAADSLGTILELMGATVAVLYDGASALEAMPKFRPDAVLLDIGMPTMDGYEVARRIRRDEANAGLRMIALTGWGQDAARRLSREVGFDDHWVKPVDPQTLLKLFDPPAR